MDEKLDYKSVKTNDFYTTTIFNDKNVKFFVVKYCVDKSEIIYSHPDYDYKLYSEPCLRYDYWLMEFRKIGSLFDETCMLDFCYYTGEVHMLAIFGGPDSSDNERRRRECPGSFCGFPYR